MAKNIVLCSDGTGNSTVKNRGTNVYKLYEALDLRTPPDERFQVAFYDDGVGTGSLKVLRIFGGACGYGFARNIRDLYTNLARVYRPGDSIFLFGFSRGAYTVRALAGLIATCGILNGGGVSERRLRHEVSEAYRVYRLRFRPERDHERAASLAAAFRRKHGVYEPGDPVRIAFIGVWDTVGAVGLPDDAWLKKILWMVTGYRVPWFKHYRLGDIVDRACHAPAIDDERQTFHPVLWDERRADGSRDSRIDQAWFAGVHSNVGGGYPKQGMSLVTLDWMMRNARAAGLRFSALDGQMYGERHNVHDKLYDSRRGLAFYYRYSPRDIAAISGKFGIEQPRIHWSALERIGLRTEGYAPGNIPRTSVVVGHGADQTRLGQLQAVLHTTLRAGLPLDAVRGLVRVRKVGHLTSLFASVVLALWFLVHGVATKGLAAAAADAVSVSGLAGLGWRAISANPLPVSVLLAVAVAGWLSSWRARRRMQDRFAEIWRPGVEELRSVA